MNEHDRFHPATSDFWNSIKRTFGVPTSPEQPAQAPHPTSPVPVSSLEYEQLSYPPTRRTKPQSSTQEGPTMSETMYQPDEEIQHSEDKLPEPSSDLYSGQITRMTRVEGNTEPEPQTMGHVEKVNALNTKDLELPIRALDVVVDRSGHKIDPQVSNQHMAQLLAQSELDVLNLTEDIKAKATPILEKIALESADKYTSAVFKGESVDGAIKGASIAGIAHATELVQAIVGTEANASELLAKANLSTLLKMVEPNVEADLSTINKLEVAQHIRELANAQDSWLEDNQKKVINYLLDNPQEASDLEANALLIAATGVHVSWAAIQGPRSTSEESQQAILQQVIADRNNGVAEAELVAKYSKLRIFAPAFRTFPAMERAMFSKGLAESGGNSNLAVAKAVLEIMKDLVKIGLPQPAEAGMLTEDFTVPTPQSAEQKTA